MSKAIKIFEDLYFVGVFDPKLKIFDIIINNRINNRINNKKRVKLQSERSFVGIAKLWGHDPLN